MDHASCVVLAAPFTGFALVPAVLAGGLPPVTARQQPPRATPRESTYLGCAPRRRPAAATAACSCCCCCAQGSPGGCGTPLPRQQQHRWRHRRWPRALPRRPARCPGRRPQSVAPATSPARARSSTRSMPPRATAGAVQSIRPPRPIQPPIALVSSPRRSSPHSAHVARSGCGAARTCVSSPSCSALARSAVARERCRDCSWRSNEATLAAAALAASAAACSRSDVSCCASICSEMRSQRTMQPTSSSLVRTCDPGPRDRKSVV